MSDDVTVWKKPDWLSAYEPFFRDLGAHKVETLMNCYGAKCAGRLVKMGMENQSQDSIDLAALICNVQVGLLVSLKSAGLLRDTGAGGQGDTRTAEELAARVDDLFEVPLAVWRDGSPCHHTILLLRQDVAATLAGRPLASKGEKP